MKAGVSSPVGALTLIAEDGALTALDWRFCRTPPEGVLADAANQLKEYFAGERKQFDLPLEPGGSTFQESFYAALNAIPFGETRTYGELSGQLNVSAQAIGQACGANPLAIFIPCHRVLAANGLGGYSGAGGIETKVALLKLEGAAGLLI